MNNQKGNALWFILIAISLLGLLTIMLSRSSSTSNETGNYEQSMVKANEILNYTKNIENSVQGLLARGCSENEISFWTDTDNNGTEDASDDYHNAESPVDHSCHVFDTAGTGVTLTPPNENWLDSSESGGFNFGEFVFSSTNTVVNLENNRDELLIILEWLDQSTCQAINNVLFSEATITEDPGTFSHDPSADGDFDTVADNIDLSSYAPHDGQGSACFSSQTDGGFHFYHAIHAR